MIHAVYIIRKTGESLYFKRYTKSAVDENLISGFLSALQNFVSEVSSGDVIRTIKTGNIKFIYNITKNIIYVFVVDQNENEDIVRSKIDKVSELFYSKYSDILENWTGEISRFSDFDETLDDIISGVVKISLIGFGGVGKTTILKLIQDEEIPMKHNPTIAVNIKPVGDLNMPGFKLILWDFAGQERFESLWKTLIKGSDIILVVIDSTMINLLKTRRKIMKLIEEFNPAAQVLILANKQDLPRAIKPKTIEGILNRKAYGIVAIDPTYKKKIVNIIHKAVDEWNKKQAEK
ncbi:MAG: ADP-ribosylation factor-like protein [Candidatus Odinarchaeia archaeon]